MTNRQQSIFFLVIVFLFTSGVGLLVYKNYNEYYEQKTDIELETANTQVPSETSHWKTYTNSQYGFTLKYPSSYSLNDSPGKQPYFEYEISEVASFSGKSNYIDSSLFSVFADNNSVNLSMCLKDDPGSANPKDLTETKEINGNNFYVLYDNTSDNAMGGARGTVSEYHIIHNGYCYILNSNIYWREAGYLGIMENGKSDATPQETQDQAAAININNEILNQMLSSFKFTE